MFERIYLKKDANRFKGESKAAFERIVTQKICPSCKGARLNKAALDSKTKGKNIAECAAMQTDSLLEFVGKIESKSAAPVVSATVLRLEHLVSIGLGYLSLNRETATLSGSESQRVKMVRHLGSSLVDMMYIFDEPSVGLHPRDVSRLNDLIVGLRDKGNTILVVEHDPDVIEIADHIVDVGLRAGKKGGEIVYQGDLKNLAKAATLTGKCWNKKNSIKLDCRQPNGFLSVENATPHNLKNVSVKIPREVLTVVTGVAGSGKSSLINGVLTEKYPEIISINQKGISGSRRSNAATFTGILETIRRLFADADAVKASLFSSNSVGACPECNGLGVIYLDLAFMDSVVTTCEVCKGRRFTEKVLGFSLRGKNIFEVLQMSVTQACEFFVEKEIRPTLERLIEVGPEYVTLGQPLNTFSGGERQRLKFAVELEKEGRIYVFDEPTTGLHMSDVGRLLNLLDRIVTRGGTVIVMEHSLEVISQADWIIDLGPEAGDAGGEIIFEGFPSELVDNKKSSTGIFLNKYIKA